MNVKKKYFVLFILILSVAFIGVSILRMSFEANEDYTTKVYKLNNGYGYSISFKNKLVIKQNVIPYIQSNQSFCNFEDAQKVANLVKEKLSNKENPVISLKELKNLSIQLNCSN